MIKKEILSLEELNWNEIRGKFTTAISGKQLMIDEWSNIKMTFTQVQPNGEFPIHIDDYHHIFLFLEGYGVGYIEKDSFEIKPNLLVRISAGVKHGYKNTSDSDMLLITMNIPKKE
ncbi:MAG: cupin domain-containing protein [Asgard group archaeon]|nr:cupin domain-containing protein [Asgard group archaeon]